VPTFIAIRDGQEIDRLRGADIRGSVRPSSLLPIRASNPGLQAMVLKHYQPPKPALAPAAEAAKAEGNVRLFLAANAGLRS
jgi:hypothetical protein